MLTLFVLALQIRIHGPEEGGRGFKTLMACCMLSTYLLVRRLQAEMHAFPSTAENALLVRWPFALPGMADADH